MTLLKDKIPKYDQHLPTTEEVSECLKPLQSEQQLKDHIERDHAELVEMGISVPINIRSPTNRSTISHFQSDEPQVIMDRLS